MKLAKLLFIIGLCLFYTVSAYAEETTISNGMKTTELWEGKALSARFKVGMCYTKKGQAWGVLILRHRNGQEDTYHLYGTLKDGHFDLSHSSGHVMRGDITGRDTMEGKARLKNGLSLTLSGKRYVNVPLKASDCAPMR